MEQKPKASTDKPTRRRPPATSKKAMNAPHLIPFYAEALRFYLPKLKNYNITVQLYAYTGLNHTIRSRDGVVGVRVSDVMRAAPIDIHRSLAYVLVAKLLRRDAPPEHDRAYRAFSLSDDVRYAAQSVRQERGRKQLTSAQGDYYNLEAIFARLNSRYFQGSIAKPTLSWSRNRTHRIMGHHDPLHDTIIISRTLDSAGVPEWVLDYVVYHEMLHIKHPPLIYNGRRYIHTRSFKVEEERFPYFDEANAFLEKLVTRLRNQG